MKVSLRVFSCAFRGGEGPGTGGKKKCKGKRAAARVKWETEKGGEKKGRGTSVQRSLAWVSPNFTTQNKPQQVKKEVEKIEKAKKRRKEKKGEKKEAGKPASLSCCINF